jgi:hypothetical protein
VEALQAELDRLAEQLAADQALLERLEITRQVVLEVLAGQAPGDQAAAVSEAGMGAAPPRMGVPVAVFGPDGDGRGLPTAYRDVVEVLADAGVPLRARQVCQAVGTGAERGSGRGCGSSPERLVERGWLVEVSPGLFACAAGVAATLDGGG